MLLCLCEEYVKTAKALGLDVQTTARSRRRGDRMKRREFITLLGGAAAAWPMAARAQRGAMPTIGVLLAGAPKPLQAALVGFRRGLADSGYVGGQNVTIEYRFAEGRLERLPMLAADLVRAQVAVLVVSSPDAARLAKQATATIPIVFSIGGDPVQLGLIASLSRPGGNVTGVFQFTAALEAKRLGLLHEMVPKATTLAALVHANYLAADAQVRDIRDAATRLGIEVVVLTANSEIDFDGAFATLAQQRAGGLLVCASPFLYSRHERLVALTAQHSVPAIYEWREIAAAGGLMSYGTSLPDAYQQAGAYAGRILKGAKPADLPAVQSTKFEFVINLRTARSLGLDIPANLLSFVDEVIE
jgi:putative ABC transport system substrate-binding protein